MQLGVAVQQTQRHAVGGGAAGGEVVSGGIGLQMRRMDRNHPRAALQAMSGVTQFAVAGHGAQRGGAEFLDALPPLGALLGRGRS
jgi:hypothetical protein